MAWNEQGCKTTDIIWEKHELEFPIVPLGGRILSHYGMGRQACPSIALLGS